MKAFKTGFSTFKLLLCLVIFAGSGCVHQITRRGEEAQLQHKVGLGHLDAGNLPAAFSALMAAEKLDPEDAGIQNSLGLAYFLREKYELAEVHFKRSIKFKSDFSDAKNNLGRTWVELGRFDDAITILNEVLNDMTYPNPERPLLNLGLAYFKQGQFRTSLEKFSQCLKVDREHCLGNNYYGRALYDLQQFSKAAAALDRAVLYCQKIQFEEPHYYSALSYYQAGDQSRAFARLEELVKLYPNGVYTSKAQKLLKELRK